MLYARPGTAPDPRPHRRAFHARVPGSTDSPGEGAGTLPDLWLLHSRLRQSDGRLSLQEDAAPPELLGTLGLAGPARTD
jgi:hypothetical protein